MRQQNPDQCQTAKHVACFVVAIPTSILNSLAALSSKHNRLGELTSPNDLADFISENATLGKLIYAILVLSGSQATLFYLNRKYLFPSLKNAIELIQRCIYLFCDICACNIEPDNYVSTNEIVNFSWSFFTSLIFGELGSKALSFLGKTGSIIGFTLNMIVYFSTRFASVNFIIEDFRSSSSKIKKKHINNLLLYNLNNIQTETKITTEIIPSDAKDNVSPAVENWLSDLGQTPTDKKRVICIKHISPVLSVTLVAITALPIVWSFIPESVQGLESFTHTNVGHDSGYKNAGSITFGIFATSLTMLFYELNIKELPKHLMITALTIYEKLRNKQIASAVKLFGLTIVALGASYFTGIGFKFAAKTAVTNGYLSYLGDWLSNAVPDFLLTAVTTMLWSHLQDLINQVHVFKTKEYDLTTIESINSKNIMALLYNPKVEITTSLPPSPDDIESGHTQGYQTF